MTSSTRFSYCIRYRNPQTGVESEFEHEFTRAHVDEAAESGFLRRPYATVGYTDSLPEPVALALVNKWNRQNAGTGFTYYLKEE